jgi:hypothetical protein
MIEGSVAARRPVDAESATHEEWWNIIRRVTADTILEGEQIERF